MKEIKEVDDLLDSIWGPRLLTVSKGCVCDEDLIRRIHENKLVIKFDSADFIVRENVPV